MTAHQRRNGNKNTATDVALNVTTSLLTVTSLFFCVARRAAIFSGVGLKWQVVGGTFKKRCVSVCVEEGEAYLGVEPLPGRGCRSVGRDGPSGAGAAMFVWLRGSSAVYVHQCPAH